jgi:hypothetical protein
VEPSIFAPPPRAPKLQSSLRRWPFRAHRPAALGEWQLQRLLGALHKRGARRHPSAARLQNLGDGPFFVHIAPPLAVSGTCSGSWEVCTNAVLPLRRHHSVARQQ